VPLPVWEQRRIRSVWEWDERISAPKFGFSSADEYYQTQSVSQRLDRLAAPTLAVYAEHDPMVSARTIRTILSSEIQNLTVRFAPRGGHVRFPEDLDLGFGGEPGLEAQVFAWMRAAHA